MKVTRFDLRRGVRGVGRTLIAIGVLLFLFVGYQLWGTGIQHSRAQDRLRSEFAQTALTAPPTLPVPGGVGLGAPRVAPALGDAVALLEIPKVDMQQYVVEGVGVEDLKAGPGHYPDTPLPGEKGNAAIAGHRTTYGAPFYDLNELEPGDPIYVTTSQGRFRYDVKELLVVHPVEGAWVLDPTTDDRLTLTTCEPRFSAAKRLIVVADLVGTPVESVAAPAPAPDPATTAPEPAPARSLDAAGLSGEGASRTPTVMWGGGAGLVWLAAWLVAHRRTRRGVRSLTYLCASPVFFFALYHFYENVALLLPANA